MRLTLHTDYALRVLMYVSTKGGELATIGEIVKHFDISKGHIMKVVHELGQLGYLETVRGKNGGLTLARKPSQICVGTVVRQVENELGVAGCLQGTDGFCRIENCCVLRSALRDATKAFLAVLDGYTLEDLLKPRRSLKLLLDLGNSSHSHQHH